MSPRTKEQFEDIRETKKRLIMDTALELFASEGYYPTSISTIARKAGIAKGLIYNYFESKEDLVISIIDRDIEEMMQYFDPNKDGKLTKDEFLYFLDAIFRILKEKQKNWKFLFAIMVQPSVFELIQHKYEIMLKRSIVVMGTYFRDNDFEDPEMHTLVFGSLLDGLSFNYIMDPDNFPIDRIKDHIIKHFLK